MVDQHKHSRSDQPKVLAVGRRDSPLEVAIIKTLGELCAMPGAIAEAISGMLRHCATAVMILEGSPARLTLASGCNLTRRHTSALMMLRHHDHPVVEALTGASERQGKPLTLQQGRLRWNLLPLIRRRPGRQPSCLGVILTTGQQPSLQSASALAATVAPALDFSITYHNWRLESDALQGDTLRTERETLRALIGTQTADNASAQQHAHLRRLIERSHLLSITLGDLLDDLDSLQETIGPDGEVLGDDWSGLRRQLHGHALRIDRLGVTLRGCADLLESPPQDRDALKEHPHAGAALISTT